MSESPGDEICAPSEWATASVRVGGSAAGSSHPPSEPSADDIRAALDSVGGSVGKAARILRLSSRFALYRLMKKHAVSDKE